MAVSQEVLLQMNDIDMRFMGVHALDGVSFNLVPGEVHALVGENGAGKSTLMKILIGLYTPNAGEIVYKSEPVEFRSVRETRDAGICMIFQEFNQAKHMTVAENIFLGREPKTKLGSVDFKTMTKEAMRILDSMSIDIDPKSYVRDLSVAKQQLVEIVKAVSQNADIIIMDEPTSALSNVEIENLMETVTSLKNEGKSIVFISHKLEEIFGVCDRVTILRDGHFIRSCPIKDIDEKELIRLMVNRDISEMFPKIPAEIKEVVLEVKNLTVDGLFENVSFTLRRGEILGLAGLMGAGRTEVVETLMGSRERSSGEVFLNGKPIVNKRPENAIERGIILVPEDRKRHGVIMKLSVKDNILMSALKKCLKGGRINRDLEIRYADEQIAKLEIKASSRGQICGNLSGGNQQKVAIARILNAEPEVIILDEPTRGIDVKTKSDIHRLMSTLAGQGKAVLMISSEMAEILGMSDRIVVLHEGQVTGILDREEADSNTIMKYAIGFTGEEVEIDG